jgi:alpha-D-xyloside xylohydrolase
LLREVRGEGEAVVFARSATAGGQQFPVHWGGDCESTFPAMAETLRGGLSLGLSGFGFWSHDIGGFEGKPDAAVYKRWLPFGLLSSHSRLHGSGSYRVPWLFDEEAVAALRRFTKLKCRLMPYLYGQAVQAAQQGAPLMRAMMLEFPDDPTCDYLDQQYMLGESLLVAPVFAAAGDVTYYAPAGRWTSLLTGAVVTGPAWLRENHDFQSLPVLVRPNTALALGSRDDRPDYDYGDGVTLAVYELSVGHTCTVTVPTVSGAVDMTFRVVREAAAITVTRAGSAKAWNLLLAGVTAIGALTGGTVVHTPDGVKVAVDAGQATLRIDL